MENSSRVHRRYHWQMNLIKSFRKKNPNWVCMSVSFMYQINPIHCYIIRIYSHITRIEHFLYTIRWYMPLVSVRALNRYLKFYILIHILFDLNDCQYSKRFDTQKFFYLINNYCDFYIYAYQIYIFIYELMYGRKFQVYQCQFSTCKRPNMAF